MNIYKNPCWFFMSNGLNFSGDGKMCLMSVKGNEGSKEYASANLPFGALHCAAL